MYASPVSLLRLPPPRRRVNQGKFAPADVFLLLRTSIFLLHKLCMVNNNTVQIKFGTFFDVLCL
jgi:hypothetical protein